MRSRRGGRQWKSTSLMGGGGGVDSEHCPLYKDLKKTATSVLRLINLLLPVRHHPQKRQEYWPLASIEAKVLGMCDVMVLQASPVLPNQLCAANSSAATVQSSVVGLV